MTPQRLGATALAATILLGLQANAQPFALDGAEVDLRYSGYIGEDSELTKTALRGSAQVRTSARLSFQADLSLARYGGADFNSNNVTLHALYDATPELTLGAFYGRDEFDNDPTNFLGLEGAWQRGPLTLEAAVARFTDEVADATQVQADALWDLGNAFRLGAHFDWLEVDGEDLDLTTVSLSLGYRVSPGFDLVIEYGNNETATARFSDSDPFVAVGLRYAFGPKGGTTMGYRGLAEVVPGL